MLVRRGVTCLAEARLPTPPEPVWLMAHAQHSTRRAMLAVAISLTLPLLGACKEDEDSPTGTGSSARLAFSSDRDGNSEIYSMNADGSDVRRLTNNAGSDELPTWSPNGLHIAFASNRDGNFEI